MRYVAQPLLPARDEKVKVLKSLRRIDRSNVREKTVRGQYTAGTNVKRHDAHRFYLREGYEQSHFRFTKAL